MIKEFIEQILDADRYQDEHRSAYICQAVCLLTIFPALMFSAAGVASNNYTYVAILMSICVLNIIAFVWYRLTRRYNPLVYYFIIAYGVLFVLLLTSGAKDGEGVYTLFAYPMIIYAVGGLARGTLFSFLYLLLISFILLNSDYLDVDQYSKGHRYRILGSLLFITILSYIMEWTRSITHKRWLQTRDELSKIAVTDSMTGLLNRRGGKSALEYELKRSKRNDGCFGVLMMDIDNFKQLNDTCGHDFGDQVITRVAGILTDNTRSTDHKIRWGGEEFLVALPDSSFEYCCKKAERLREVIENCEIVCTNTSTLTTLTISIGVGHSSLHGELNEIIADADKKLFEAKDKGRNAVVCI